MSTNMKAIILYNVNRSLIWQKLIIIIIIIIIVRAVSCCFQCVFNNKYDYIWLYEIFQSRKLPTRQLVNLLLFSPEKLNSYDKYKIHVKHMKFIIIYMKYVSYISCFIYFIFYISYFIYFICLVLRQWCFCW